MLLSGIYYGRIPIARAYKNGEIIWSSGTDRKIGDAITNVQCDMVAYITSSAREYFCAEDGIEFQHIAVVKSSGSECAEVLESCLFAISPTLDVYKSNLEQIEVDISSSIDAVANIPQSNIEEVDEHILVEPSVLSTISLSERIDINNEAMLCDNTSIVVDDSNISDIERIVDVSSYAMGRPSTSQNGEVETRTVIQIDTNLIRSNVENSQAQTLFTLEKDAVLNVLKTKNGVAEQIVTLINQTQGTVSASITSVVSAMSMIDSDVRALVQDSENGKVQVESDIEFNTLGTVSKAEIIDVGTEEMLQSLSNIVSSGSVNSIVDDIRVCLESVANANTGESAQSTVEQEVTGEFSAYIGVQDADHSVIDVCEIFATNESAINISPTENVKIYNMRICVDSNSSMQVSDGDILHNNTEIQVDSDANMHIGIIFKTLLDESLSISSNNNMNIILPIDMIVEHGLQSGSDASFTNLEPTDIHVTHSVQSGGAGNITTLVPLKLLLEDCIQGDCDANLTNQNTYLTYLNNNMEFNASNNLTYCKSSNISDAAMYGCETRTNHHAVICFWQLPVRRGDNLLIRQVFDVDEYPGGIIIY